MVENDVSATQGQEAPPAVPGTARHDRVRRGGRGDHSWAQDRLLRQPLELEELITLADSQPFTIAAPMDAWTEPVHRIGREMARFYVARARGEIERKTERQKAAYRQSAEMGKPHSRALGYERDGSMVEAEAVSPDIFARYVAGQGINGLVNHLQRPRELATPRAPLGVVTAWRGCCGIRNTSRNGTASSIGTA